MRHKRFLDFDEFAVSVQDVDCRMLLRNAKRRVWTIDGVEVDSIDVQLGRLGSGNIAQGTVRLDGYMIYAPLTDRVEYVANGCVVDRNACVVMEPGSEFCISTKVAHDWAAVFVPKRHFPIGGLPLQADSRICRVTRPNRPAAARFRDLVGETLFSAAQSAQFASSSSANQAAEEILNCVSAIAEWLPTGEKREGRPRVPRERVIKLALEHMERQAKNPIRIGDLAAAAGVSERTLRAVFGEFYGMGPTRFLQLNRLHQIRRALKAADSEHASVSQILIDHGEWAFSRFASRYRRLFGELPSQTLRAK